MAEPLTSAELRARVAERRARRGETVALTADELRAQVAARRAARASAPPPPPPTYEQEQKDLQETAAGVVEDRANADMKSREKKQEQRAESQQGDTWATRRTNETIQQMVPGPKSVEPAPGHEDVPEHLRAPRRFQTHQDFSRGMVKQAKEMDPTYNDTNHDITYIDVNGKDERGMPMIKKTVVVPGEGRRVKVQMPGIIDTRTQLIDKNDDNNAVSMMDSMGSFDQSKVPGWNLLSRLGGTGSNLQQAVTGLGRLGFDPSSGKALGGAVQVADPSELGPAPMGAQTGYGFPEAGADMGELIGRNVPTSEDDTARMIGKGGAGLQHMYAGYEQSAAKNKIAELEKKQKQGVHPIVWGMGGGDLVPNTPESIHAFYQNQIDELRPKADPAAEDAAKDEAVKYFQFLDEAKDPEQLKEINRVFGQQAGRMVGSGIQQTVSPTLGLGKLIPQAAKLKVAEKLEPVTNYVDEKKRGAWEAFTGGKKGDEGLANIVSTQPSANILSDTPMRGMDISPATVARAGKSIRDNAIITDIIRKEQALRGSWDAILKKHGATDTAAVNREFMAAQASPAARHAASPVVKELFDVWQPAHLELFNEGKRLGLFGDDIIYNPLQKIYGQSSSKRGGTLEELEAEAARAGNQPRIKSPQQGQEFAPGAMAGVPGARALPPNVLNQSKSVGGRSMEDLAALREQLAKEKGHSAKEAEKIAAETLGGDPVQLLMDSRKKMLARGGHGTARMAEYVAPKMQELQRAAPDKYFASVDDLRAHLGQQHVPNKTQQLDVLGNVRGQGRVVETRDVDNYLRDNDLVVVKVQMSDAPMLDKTLTGMYTRPIPKEMAALDGQVMPRRMFTSMQEAYKPIPDGAWIQKTREWDKAIGLSQAKGIITQANIGFEQRNIMSDMMKAGGEEGFGMVFSPKNMDDWSEIANAKMGDPTGPLIQIGKYRMTPGQWQEKLVELNGTGHGFHNEAMRDLASSGPIPDRMMKLISTPAKAAGAATKKALFSGRGIPDSYSASDNIRMLTTLQKVKRGIPLEKAAEDVNTLLINYRDKSNLVKGAGPLVSFPQYYAGTAKMLTHTAMKNPAAFGNVYNMMRDVEGVDEAVHGGAFDPRIKPVSSQIALEPMFESGGRPQTLRMEHQMTEAGPFMEALTGTSDKGFGQYAHVLPSWAYEMATGDNLATGRSSLGISKNDRKAAYPTILGDALQMAEMDAQEGETKGQYFGPPLHIGGVNVKPGTALFNRVVSPIATPNVQQFQRSALGQSSSAGARTMDDEKGALQKAIIRMMGPKLSPINPGEHRLKMEEKYKPKVSGDTEIETTKAKKKGKRHG